MCDKSFDTASEDTQPVPYLFDDDKTNYHVDSSIQLTINNLISQIEHESFLIGCFVLKEMQTDLSNFNQACYLHRAIHLINVWIASTSFNHLDVSTYSPTNLTLIRDCLELYLQKLETNTYPNSTLPILIKIIYIRNILNE